MGLSATVIDGESQSGFGDVHHVAQFDVTRSWRRPPTNYIMLGKRSVC